MDALFNSLTEAEKEATEHILALGRGIACTSQRQAQKSYPNLINNQLVYIDTWGGGSPSLRLTNKGEEFIKTFYTTFSKR